MSAVEQNHCDGFNVLNDVIETLRFRGSIFFHSNLSAPWGMSLSQQDVPRFHIALEGDCYIGALGQQISMKSGNIVLLPAGDMHWIADKANRILVPSEEAGRGCQLGGRLFQNGPVTNRLMCGMVEYDDEHFHPIISALPDIFHFDNINPSDNIWMTVCLIDAEILRSGNQQSGIVDRLTEVLFMQLLDKYIRENDYLAGFLGALRDKRLAKVLQLIHQNPEKSWTIDMMSDEIGMSRATLTRNFNRQLGLSPMAYVSRWRMAKAYKLVRYSSLSLEQIASEVGFKDARTLRRAFNNQYQISPTELRKRGVNTIST